MGLLRLFLFIVQTPTRIVEKDAAASPEASPVENFLSPREKDMLLSSGGLRPRVLLRIPRCIDAVEGQSERKKRSHGLNAV